MGLSIAWKRNQNLFHCVFVMTWRHYQGFPGKWCGCVDFIQHGVYSSGNNWSLAGFKKALLCPVVGVLWRLFLILRLGAVMVRGEAEKPFWFVSEFLIPNIHGQEFSRLLKLWIREGGGWKTCSFTDSPGKCPSQMVGSSWFLQQQQQQCRISIRCFVLTRAELAQLLLPSITDCLFESWGFGV